MRRYTGVAALSCVLFTVIACGLFFSVLHLQSSRLSTDNTIGTDALSSSVVSTIQAGKTGSHRLHSFGGKFNRTLNCDRYIPWLVVGTAGAEIYTYSDDGDSQWTISGSLVVLGNAVHAVRTQEDVIELRLWVADPRSGWVTVSTANLSSCTVLHHLRPLNTTVSQIDVQVQSSGQCNAAVFMNGMDYKGGDITGNPAAGISNPVTVNSAAECCARCSRTPSCMHWTLLSQSECWLKTNAATLVQGDPAKHLVSGTVDSVHRNSPPVRRGPAKPSIDRASTGPAVTSSVRCCAHPSAEGNTAPLSYSSLSVLQEVLGSLRAPVLEQSCDSQNKPHRCTVTGTVLLSHSAAALIALMLTEPIALSDRIEALQPDKVRTAISDVNTLCSGAPAHRTGTTGRQRDAARRSTDTIRPVFQPERLTADWTDQQPIGTGRFGALVGGNIRSEVIPLSVAGLFFRQQQPAGTPHSYSLQCWVFITVVIVVRVCREDAVHRCQLPRSPGGPPGGALRSRG
jgi:hypothetical protein